VKCPPDRAGLAQLRRSAGRDEGGPGARVDRRPTRGATPHHRRRKTPSTPSAPPAALRGLADPSLRCAPTTLLLLGHGMLGGHDREPAARPRVAGARPRRPRRRRVLGRGCVGHGHAGRSAGGAEAPGMRPRAPRRGRRDLPARPAGAASGRCSTPSTSSTGRASRSGRLPSRSIPRRRSAASSSRSSGRSPSSSATASSSGPQPDGKVRPRRPLAGRRHPARLRRRRRGMRHPVAAHRRQPRRLHRGRPRGRDVPARRRRRLGCRPGEVAQRARRAGRAAPRRRQDRPPLDRLLVRLAHRADAPQHDLRRPPRPHGLGRPVERVVSRLVDDATFAEVQRVLSSNQASARRNCRREYLLRGLLVCADPACGCR
jgi:hypothetical protein